MNLSELFMKIAKEMKNDHFFGIPGSGVPLDLMDSGKNIDLHFINVAHESTAAIAAGTYGLIKESAGLCLGVKGVGAGSTSFKLELMHGDHADYTSTKNVPVVVTAN